MFMLLSLFCQRKLNIMLAYRLYDPIKLPFYLKVYEFHSIFLHRHTYIIKLMSNDLLPNTFGWIYKYLFLSQDLQCETLI